MVHGGGLDPHWFDYPSLLLYLLAPFQSFEGSPSYLAGRLVVLVLALGAVAAAWWLGSRAYGGPAGAVAAALVAVETTEVAYSRMAVTDVPLTLGVAVSLAICQQAIEIFRIETRCALCARWLSTVTGS